MKKHVPMNPAWFEPGADGYTPFEQYYPEDLPPDRAISAAFRALIAQEQATEPPALKVGDVVRLEACPEREGHVNSHLFVGRVDAIEKMADTWDIQAPCAWFTIPQSTTGQGIWWPVSALTLVRRAGEPAPVDAHADEIARLTAELHARNDEIVGLRAEVYRLTEQRDYNAALWVDMKAERDALRARIDAGVRVYSFGEDAMTWMQFQGGTDTHTALLIDSRPIAAADERKGERRQTQFIGHVSKSTGERIYPRDGEGYQPASRTFPVNRRRNAGTIADRGKVS